MPSWYSLRGAVHRNRDLIQTHQRHMPTQLEVENLVLVWNEDQEILGLIREFLEPLGYTVQFASEAYVTVEAAD
jgi:CheY-like chemotaxis protein